MIMHVPKEATEGTALMSSHEMAKQLLAERDKLRSELADVKAENEKYRQWHSNGRANIEFTNTGVRLCEGEHPSYAPCVWVDYVAKADNQRHA